MNGNFYCEGVDKAPQRSLFHALGMTKEEMERPLVGIVSSYNEIVPGHMNIDKIVEAVKMGVAMAGGTPVVFPAIAVCDGIAMGHKGMKYSLVTRDLIADSTECMALAHHFDALVMIPNCDKNVPGLLMAAARVNVPTVFVSGGPMLAGHVKGKKTSLSSMFEAVGSYAAGKFTLEDVEEFENNACPTCGSCSGMYTANSMNCLTEVLGMGLRGNGTIPAVYSERIKLAKQAGMAVMDMYRKNIRPRDIMTADAFENALTADMALGCSTNSMLHLPAIANECGIKIDLDMVNQISARTPNICHLAPAGHAYMEDLNEAGGIYAVLNEQSAPHRCDDCHRQDHGREHQGMYQQEHRHHSPDRSAVQRNRRYCCPQGQSGSGSLRCKAECRCKGNAGTQGTGKGVQQRRRSYCSDHRRQDRQG